MPLQIFLFGAPRFERNGKPISIQRRKVMALLSYLAATGQAHSRDSLATLFWPEHDQTEARANLRRDLYWLKQALGEELLVTDQDQISLSPQADLWLDVEEFKHKISQVKGHNHEIDSQASEPVCTACLASLSEAVKLYTGDFMAGFSLADSPAFDEWQFFQSDSLQRSLAEALQWLVRWHGSQAEYEQGIEYGRRWLALDNLHEPAHRQLMLLFAWSGQQAAALRQYQECLRLLAEELGVEPEEETTCLYETIRTRQVAPPVGASNHARRLERPGASPAPFQKTQPLHNLPTQPSRIIGREKELAEIGRLLLEEAACRLLTLTGPGGSGKTSLAIEVAIRLIEQREDFFTDGVWLIPLAPLDSADSVVPAIAQALNFSFYADQEQRHRQLLDYLRPKRLLLVLDNFEHLVDFENVNFIADILATAPLVKLLVTSRTRLNARSEQLFPVAGLKTPPAETAYLWKDTEMWISDFSAIEMFQISAMRVRPDFKITSDDLPSVVQICQLVEGMPLGIELAAAWLELLSPVEIVEEIKHSLDFLEVEWRDAPDRQRSLRAVFESSWGLLDDQERSALKSLTVFQGSFSREAAQAVSGVSLKTLLTLVNKSWLHRAGQGRYQYHELLRQYAAEKLQADLPAWQQARDRHSAYYADFLANQEEVMKGPGQKEAFQAVSIEFENIRLAWKWLVERNKLETVIQRMLISVFRYCEARARSFELMQLLDISSQALAEQESQASDPYLLAILSTARAAFYDDGYPIRYETFGLFIPANQEALSLAWSLSMTSQKLHSMNFWEIMLAYLYGRVVNQDAGIIQLRRLLLCYREEKKHWELAFAMYSLGNLLEVILSKQPENKTAQEETWQCLSEASAIFQELGDACENGCTQRALGNLHSLRKDFKEAIHHWKIAQERLQMAGEWALAADIHWQIGDVHLRMGEFEEAFRRYQAMREIYAEMGNWQVVSLALSKESYEAVRYSDLETARQLRRQALALAQEVDDQFGVAWNNWEMGEIYRVSGDTPAALQWYEQAKTFFEKVQDEAGLSFYHRGMGDIAQAKGQAGDAVKHFSKSLRFAQEREHIWGMAYACSGLGRACTGLEQFEIAREHFAKALQNSKLLGDAGLTLFAFAGVAGLYLSTGEIKKALELSELVTKHKLSWNETKAQAAAVLATAKSLLSSHIPDPQDMGSNSDIWEIAGQLIEAGTVTERNKT